MSDDTPAPPAPKRRRVTATKAVAALRDKRFVEEYLTNGNNATQAAIAVGFSPKNANVDGCRMMAKPHVKEVILARTEAVLRKAELSTERWAEEMAAIAHFDPGELYDDAGNLIPIKQLPAHVRRAIASIKPGSDGEEAEVKAWDKNVALANVGKHLGVFESDNRQRTNAIQVNVVLRG